MKDSMLVFFRAWHNDKSRALSNCRHRYCKGLPECPFIFRGWNLSNSFFFSTLVLLAGNRLDGGSVSLRWQLKFL